MKPIDVSKYVPTDAFFGAPYIDGDIEVATLVPRRIIHGGFADTATRFRFHFPSKDAYRGRMFTPVSGGNGGTEMFFDSVLGEAIGGVTMCVRLGGYVVESNQGHIGETQDPKAGGDPTIYGHRATAESARFSKYVAEQVYGSKPHHSYVFGGSGGGRRSPLCFENAPDVWDGAVPFMGGGDVAEHGNKKRLKGAQTISFCTMFNVQRVLGDKLKDVIDAMAPGGSGDPYAGLNNHQREELSALYRLGYPRGDEVMIGAPMGQMWQWTAEADSIYEQDPAYFENFWTKPGYTGHDQPEVLAHDRIDTTVTVTRVLSAQEVLDDPAFNTPEFLVFRALVQGVAAGTGMGMSKPSVIQVNGLGSGYRLGTGVRVVDGKGAGRQLYAMAAAGDYFFCDGSATNSAVIFTGMVPGDKVHIDNSRWLAYGYFARHHIMDDLQFDFLRVDGRALYPQHPLADLSPFMGVCYSGQFKGKLMWVHHTHDASLWPPQGVIYANAVLKSQGEAGQRQRFRLRWAENAEHVPPHGLPSAMGRAPTTWLIDYVPFLEQSIQDVVDWVEHGIEPAGTNYSYRDGKVTLPNTAAERGGIQVVVHVTANGTSRAEVKVGEPVILEVQADMPGRAGTIIEVKWDFDGSGTYPFTDGEVDGKSSSVTLKTTHSYDRPGTYFATALVHSHRDGDVKAMARRVPNLAQARIVVK